MTQNGIAQIDADQDQRRLERNRGERVHRHAMRVAMLVDHGDDGDAGGEAGRRSGDRAPGVDRRRADLLDPTLLDIEITLILSSVCTVLSGGRLIKLDIINEVVNKTGITKTKAEMAVETVFEKMKRALEQGDRIELRGFGVFTVKPRKTGIGRNPRTGAEVSIPPGKAVRFKPGKELQTLQ